MQLDILKILFWFSVIMIFYAYFGYPLALMAISFVRNKKRKRREITPNLSFIITAYNEENTIQDKLENTLALSYPPQLFEIIVASDCSSDKTDEIVRSYAGRGVKLVRAHVRKGKEHAQKLAVREASGDILVFSDVGTILEQDALKNIVSNFADPTIGCVSSVDRFINPDGSVSGEGAYVKYEMFLRSLESRVNTLVGLSGSFFAARKEVCRDWAEDLQSDFNTLLNSVKRGLRGISDPETVGFYKNIADEKKEFNRKVRTVLRGISVLMRNLSLLNPFRYGLFAWQLFSHKFCRWLVPFFLLIAFFSNAVLALKTASPLYSFMFIGQICFYALALLYHFFASSSPAVTPTGKSGAEVHPGHGKSSLSQLLKIPYYFVTVNASILVAWAKYIRGERATFWEPSKRV